jgi:hypothetical protein
LQREVLMRLLLIPEGHAGVVIGIRGGGLAVNVLVLDFHFQRLLKAHRIS